MALPRREDIPQPDAEMVFGVIKRMKLDEPEVAQQLDVFFELFRGFGVPMTFAPASLHALDEAFPALMEQLETETGTDDEEEGEDLMLIIQLCGFWLGTVLIETMGGGWVHDEEEGSYITGMDGMDSDYDPFDPFIKKAKNPRASIVKEVEKATGLPLRSLATD